MSVITRKFSACPVRTAADTWNTIVGVLAANDTTIQEKLLAIEGIAASIIADGSPKKDAITVIGTGHRLRIYCLYDEEGSTDDANESSLNWNPFEGDWEIHFPVDESEIGWVRKALTGKGKQFKVYEVGASPLVESEEQKAVADDQDFTIDLSKL